MNKQIIIFSIMLLACATRAFSQHDELGRITDSITSEGKALYRSEWASWYGTDIFTAKCPEIRKLSGGYFSYETNDNLVNLFFSKDVEPVVIATVTFKKDLNANNYKLDSITRKFSKAEQDYFMLRSAAKKRIETDTTFKYFKNTSLNIIPLIQKDVKKVYALTGPNVNGVVIFGNDYLINFNKKYEITSVRTLHKNIIPIYTKADSGKTAIETMHSHLQQTGDFITATDICTLMLYEKYTTWNQHVVMSKGYISIWDCKKDLLAILTREAWDKINAAERAGLKKE